MKRSLALIGILLLFFACALGLSELARPPLAQVLLPGARDINVVRTGVAEWEVSYAAIGTPFAWYWELTRRLEAEQWILQNPWIPYSSPTDDPLQPVRFERMHAVALWDAIVLKPDQREPNRVQARPRRYARWNAIYCHWLACVDRGEVPGYVLDTPGVCTAFATGHVTLAHHVLFPGILK